MAEQLKVENVIIIGGGPAGLAAAVYNSRANLNPLVLAGSPPGGQLMLTSDVENYPGFPSILGPELVMKMREQAQKFGTRLVDQNVLSVDLQKKPFEVKTVDNVYQTTALLIATGAKALWLDLANEQKLRGKGVSACATCDGFFFKNKTVAVVGGGDTAMEDALTLTKFANKVYLIHRRDSFRASKIMQERVLNHPKIEVIWNTAVTDVLGEMKVEGIKMQNLQDKSEKNLVLDGLFLAIGHKPDTDVFKGQIELDEKGYVVTSAMEALHTSVLARKAYHSQNEETGQGLSEKHLDHESNFDFAFQYMTSVTGVFAAGDNVDHVYRQAATAVGMGVAAALEIERWLESRA